MDDFDTEVAQDAPVPKKNYLDKLVEKNRPLKASPVGVLRPNEDATAAERSAAQAKGLQQAQQAENKDVYQEIHDAYAATVGGVARDIYRAANAEKGLEFVDPNFDVGALRDKFRRTYPMEHWEALEQVKNQSQYSHLIFNLDERLKRQEVIGESTVGNLLGAFTDPTAVVGGALFKGGAATARAYNLGKAKTIATTAAAEGSLYAGTEAALQEAEAGDVYDAASVVRTFGIGAAMHFGVGAATSSKAEFMSTKAIDADLPDVAQTVEAEAATVGNALVREARQSMADKAQNIALDIDAGKISASDLALRFDRNFSAQAYPSPVAPSVEASTTVDNALVDAGSAVNSGRADALADPIIKSNSVELQDIVHIYTEGDKATQALLGDRLKFFETPMGKLSVLTSNAYQAMVSKSPIVRELGRKLSADSIGIAREVGAEANTAYDKAIYNKQMRQHYASVHDEYKAWAVSTGRGGFYAELSGTVEQEFNNLVRHEMEARWNTKDLLPEQQSALDKARWESISPQVKRAADALDRGNQAALDLMKQHNVLGADGLSEISSGYVPRRMDGRKLQDLHLKSPEEYKALVEASGRRYYASFKAQQDEAMEYLTKNINTVIKEDLARQADDLTRKFKGSDEALAKAIAAIKPTTLEDELKKIKPITLGKATTIAEGVMQRAIDRAAGIDGSTIGLFDKAARSEIEMVLKSKGLDYSDIEHTFALLDKSLSKRSGSNRLKGRMDIDITTPDEQSGISLIDYYDNDINRLHSSYAEEMSGRIALARQGISSDNDFENVLTAIKNTNYSGSDTEKELELLRDMYSFMLGRHVKGMGENKITQVLTQVNSLQSLGQVGVAQGAELSTGAAALGVGSALKAIPILAKTVVGVKKGIVSANDALLLRDVEALTGPVGQDWRMFRPRTDVMERLNADGGIAHAIDRALKLGQHVNGFVSFMNQVMEAELKSVAVSATRKFATEIRAGVLTRRLADAGFTEQRIKSIKSTLDSHAVFKQGELYDLNLSKWSADDAEHFMRNIERTSGQLIQKDYVGETATWMHKDMGRMFMSLRGYSIKAYNKQLMRNARIADSVTALSVMYGLAFSTLGYTAKMYAASAFREDQDEFLEERLSGMALAQGALSYMSMSSFLPELLRPAASWYSEGEGGEGAIRSGGNAVVTAIPGLAPIDRVAKMVGNAGSAVIGDKDYKASHARQAISTVFGNSFPVTLAINALVDDDD